MAGIGFELRKLLYKDSYLGLVQAYGYAGLISSGPWVLSIVGVVAIGILSIGLNTEVKVVTAFLISVTYLIACSIIFGGWLQLMFTRYVSDRIYAKERELVLPNLMGALLVTTLSSVVIGLACWPLFLDTSLAYRLLMLVNLGVLSNLWLLVVMLSGLRSYNLILGTFIVGYGLSVSTALLLNEYGLEGLLAGFFIGQAMMMYMMLGLLVREYPSKILICFHFLSTEKAFYSLAAASVIYNFGIWADKMMFWFNPATSENVIGPIRSSFAYDPPIFIAYLAIIPGMAAFLLRMEADFVDHYDAFFTAIQDGETLSTIKKLKGNIIAAIQSSFLEIFKIQLMTAVTLIYTATEILAIFGISTKYSMLFSVYVAAVSIQVILLGIYNVLYYLDKRHIALYLTVLFAISNVALSGISQHLGPAFFGSGYAAAVIITTVVGGMVMWSKLKKLEYETFMLQ